LKIVKKIMKIIIQSLTVVLFALLILAIYCKVQMLVQKQDFVTIFGYTIFQVASGSMEPELYVDDVILVKVSKDIEVNDVISYLDDDAIITHRVISIDGDFLTTKGDANNTLDANVPKDAIIGKVVSVYPELKIWQDILSDPKILVSLFVTLLLFDFAFSYKKKDDLKLAEQMKNKKDLSTKEKYVKPSVDQIQENKNDVIGSEELLELTRRLDLKELRSILEKENMQNLEEQEKEDLYKTLVTLKKSDIEEFVLPKLQEKSANVEEYTLRLDLNEIQKLIANKMK